MKKILMLALAMTMVAGVAMADDIGIFTDQIGGDNCTLVPPAFQPFTVYVVHRAPGGATGSVFKLTNTSGYSLSAAVLGGYLSIGDAFTDLSLAYGGCLTGSIAVLSVNGFGFPVPGQVCGVVQVGNVPSQAASLTVDCNFAEIPAGAGKFVFNSDMTCPCIEPNATEESTWGKVKNLYR